MLSFSCRFLPSIVLIVLSLVFAGCAKHQSEPPAVSTTSTSVSSSPYDPPPKTWIDINLSKQLLTLYSADGRERVYSVSTAKKGAGQKNGSMQTPLGEHVIIEKVGYNRPWNAIYKYGAFTGKYYSPSMPVKKGEDPILSRIIRIAGTEKGYNSGGDVDTESRRIYIHGTPPSERPQDRKPTSRGCIRMDVNDVIDLFRRVDVGTRVVIKAK